MERRLLVEELWNAMLDAKAACVVRGPAYCLRMLDSDAGDDRRRLKRLCVQAPALGIVDDGDIVRILEEARG